MYSYRPTRPSVQQLKKRIVGDSLDRKRDLDRLIKMIREEESAKHQTVASRAAGQEVGNHEG